MNGKGPKAALPIGAVGVSGNSFSQFVEREMAIQGLICDKNPNQSNYTFCHIEEAGGAGTHCHTPASTYANQRSG